MKSNLLPKALLIITFILMVVFLALIIIFNIRIYKINGTSMYPTLEANEYVLSYQNDTPYERGDIIAFKYNNVVMIKRIVGLPNDTVNIAKDGTIYINDEKLYEPYLKSTAVGDVEIALPYKVPENSYFVLGDNRANSIDSRNLHIGCINKDDIISHIKYSIIPYKKVE